MQQPDCVVCSQVIEHIPFDAVIFTELRRVLRPDGLLILGTPDYATCKRHLPDDQRAKMQEYRAWFREAKRPPR